MPSSGPPLGGAEIRSHLLEVADQLTGSGPKHTVIPVGGALLAWHEMRDSTRDIDSLRRLDAELRQAVERVAKLRGLAVGWLNDHAAGSVRARSTKRSANCSSPTPACRF